MNEHIWQKNHQKVHLYLLAVCLNQLFRISLKWLARYYVEWQVLRVFGAINPQRNWKALFKNRHRTMNSISVKFICTSQLLFKFVLLCCHLLNSHFGLLLWCVIPVCLPPAEQQHSTVRNASGAGFHNVVSLLVPSTACCLSEMWVCDTWVINPSLALGVRWAPGCWAQPRQ